MVTWKQGVWQAKSMRLRFRASPLALRQRDQRLRMTAPNLAGARSRGAARATGGGWAGPPRDRRDEPSHRPRHECRLASAQREAWGVGGRGMAAERRQSLRAVAGAEARTSCAYSRGFQISA